MMKNNNSKSKKKISLVAIVTGVISFLFFSYLFENWEAFKAGLFGTFPS